MPPTYTESLDTMYATTWQLRKKKVFEQQFEATPFWLMLKRGKGIETQEGGKWIENILSYAKNETVQFIARGGQVTIAHTDHITTTHVDWKYLTGHIIRYFADYQRNRGRAQVIKRVNKDIDNLMGSSSGKLEETLFGDGTGDQGKAFDGLDNLVAEDPTATATVQGLPQGTYAWWRNVYKDMSGEASSVYLRKRMNTKFNDAGKYGEGVSRFPNNFICAQDVYELYDEDCIEIGRIIMNDKQVADLGFGDLSFKGRPITWSPSCKAGSLYGLNMNFIKFYYDPIAFMDMGEWLPIVDQPRDRISHIMTVCNIVMSNRRRHFVIFNIAE